MPIPPWDTHDVQDALQHTATRCNTLQQESGQQETARARNTPWDTHYVFREGGDADACSDGKDSQKSDRYQMFSAH